MTDLTAAKAAEEACLVYLIERCGMARVAASHWLHTNLIARGFQGMAPELKALVRSYKDALTAARGGTQ
jgi:hypothetical protein